MASPPNNQLTARAGNDIGQILNYKNTINTNISSLQNILIQNIICGTYSVKQVAISKKNNNNDGKNLDKSICTGP